MLQLEGGGGGEPIIDDAVDSGRLTSELLASATDNRRQSTQSTDQRQMTSRVTASRVFQAHGTSLRQPTSIRCYSLQYYRPTLLQCPSASFRTFCLVSCSWTELLNHYQLAPK